MSIYVPSTMIGRMALAIWNRHGKEDSPLQDAVHILQVIRRPDMNMVMSVGRITGLPPATIDIAWTQMVDAILAESASEERALAKFEGELG